MKKVMPAFLRNQISQMSLLEENKSIARVRLGARELGTWESLHPRYWCAGKEIILQISILGRCVAYSLRTVRCITGGVRLQLSGPGHTGQEYLEVRWVENADDAFPPEVNARLLLNSWIKSEFPGSQIVSCMQRTDLAKSLSKSFVRTYFRHRGKNLMALANDIDDASCDPDSGLTQALIWLGQLQRNQLLVREVPTIYILVPLNCSATLFHRSTLLNPRRVKVQVLEYERSASTPWAVGKAPQPSPPIEDRDYRWPALGPFHWSPLLLRVLDLAPGAISRYPRFQEYDSLKLAGLEFAQACGPNRERIFFGVGSLKKELTDESFPELTALVDEILFYRRADSPDPFHPYYRAQSERWLETLIMDRAPDLFPELVPECIYSQIPVYLGKDPGRVDVLGMNEGGGLVVMELKIGPDPDLPLQALDYWARVLRHNRNGDFERRSYFAGRRLKRSFPIIYLVSPVFSYHDTTEKVLRFVNPKIEVWKISVNEDWRCGVKILRRDRIECGTL
jgi:hypothetical protein